MGKHILVIDDNKLILAIMSDMLTAAGYQVSTAEDVVYCNDLIYCKSPPDLILMDINMPMMRGNRKTRILKDRPKSSHIPIILVSTINESDLGAIAADCGADGFLVKPVNAETMLAKVAQLLER